MAEAGNQMNTPAARSMLRDFVGSISTMRGDLSTITAPPFVLDTKSTVEMPQYWSENPSIFCAPAQSDDPAERAMLVLRWFLSSLRGQNYMGHSEDHGVKKPLNAFLGEVFLAKWEDSMGTTRLVSEQVSHHPPITACRVWNDEHGVEASGYTRQTITFSGAVTIKQTGHALFNLSKHNESYLIPLPELKVRGILSGTLYPELNGKYYLPSTSGYTSVIDFSGKGWFGTGRKHSLEAKVYKDEDGEGNPVYTMKGTWNQEFVIHDVRKGEDIETFDVLKQMTETTPIIIEPLEEQDPWESRRAWKDVISALNRGDMKGTVEAKSKVEQGQREMRKAEKQTNTDFQLRFFRTLSENEDNKAATLSRLIPGNNTSSLTTERNDTKGVWTFDYESWSEGKITKPYHEEMLPDNSHAITSTPTDETNILHTHEDLSPPRSKRSSLDSTNSVPSLSASIDSESSTRPASPSSTLIDNNNNNHHTQHRRSLDAFRLPFRSHRDRDRKSRLSMDLSSSSFTSPKQSISSTGRPLSSSSSPSQSPNPHQSDRNSQTSQPSQSQSQSHSQSQPDNSSLSLALAIPPHQDEVLETQRSKSLDMSRQEQLDIETMLRDKYSNSMSLSSQKQRQKRSSSGGGGGRSWEMRRESAGGNVMQRKSRLSIDSGI